MRSFYTSGLPWVRHIARGALVVAAACFVAVTLFGSRVDAQQNTSTLQQILQQIPGAQNGSGLGGQGGVVDQTQEQQQPALLIPDRNSSPLPTSRLEQILSARAGATLQQFGYNQVGSGKSVRVPQTGAIQDSYVLGPGDEVIVTFRGQENSEYRFTVDRGGQITLPRLSPIPAAGQTLGSFRQAVQDAVRRGYVSTQVFVSIGQLRQVSVVVSGEVNNPGVRVVTGLSTPLDAILLSGGVKKTGSLRSIKLVHAGQTILVDLYSILLQGGHGAGSPLSDGDRIIVPPLGKTVGISGWVRRPGIYELSRFDTALSVRRAVELAGGLEVRGRYRLAVIRVDGAGNNAMSPVTETATIRDSDILIVQPAADQIENRATLSGATPLAGIYSVGKSTTLADVLKAPGALGTTPYTLFGAISRRDPQSQMRTMIPFTPVAVLNGSENLEVANHDIVRVFTVNEARLLAAVVSAFKNRRSQSDAAMLTPESVLQSLGGAQSPTSSAASAAAVAAGIPNTNNQPMDQQQQSPTNDQYTLNVRNGVISDRRNIAELSTMVLGDGGVLVPNPLLFAPGTQPPAPVGSPQAILQDQQQQANAQQQRQLTLSSLGTQGALRFQSNQGAAPQQSQSTSDMASAGADDDYRSNSNLPPNLQRQSVSQGSIATNQDVLTFGDLARQLDVDPLVLVNFLIDNQVSVSGSIRGAGDYFVGGHASLKDVVAAAGGTDHWTDQSAVEVISTTVDPAKGVSHTERNLVSLRSASLEPYFIKPHDEIRLNQIYTSVGAGSVTIRGQVRSPGIFQIERGERLSELLLRAGGLTDVAYPYGTVFLRKSVAEVERQGYERMASELQDIFLSGMTRVGSGAIQPSTFTAVQGFIKDLHDTPPLGRISVNADPALLASKSERDPLLEPGDIIYIPQRPSTVTVLGQVMQQGSFAFDPKMSAADYVARAGGPGEFADTSLAFLVLPDGTARRVESSWFNLDSENIPPGSTIVVPREASILDTRQILFDALGVLQNLAVSAASIAVISHN